MNLLNLFAIISALIVNTLGVAHVAPEVAARSEPSLPNFCGWFKHDDSRSGWAFANEECKNFEWKNPDDERIESSFKRPVLTLQNVYCGLCFVWESGSGVVKAP
ncbi:uncharacterized protein N0V89_003982 [Didymosphaeria variabile]|uniref:Uncharacterized protein n=1 Tax=Didymosphaeria variabile TaxID=1932322 RepID=A0A9W8XPJ0_9PLEO|nr:uncharacterized protein N0V89_003982 [Didymosphaeria variabile]KAJ4355957.1 hypothetical protein N0V89_003982 [Didymosphaeria variabile]